MTVPVHYIRPARTDGQTLTASQQALNPCGSGFELDRANVLEISSRTLSSRAPIVFSVSVDLQ